MVLGLTQREAGHGFYRRNTAPFLAAYAIAAIVLAGDSRLGLVSAQEAPPELHRCDELAAHPDDPQKSRRARGVADNAIDLESAISACLDALEEWPDESRFAFQLGRTLMLGDMVNDAQGFLQDAADGGHAAASFFLGEYAGNTDELRSLNARAAEAGFAPAQRFAEEVALLEEDAESQDLVPSEEPSPTVDPQSPANVPGLAFPVLVERLYEGQFEDIPDDRQTRSVVVSLLKVFSENCGDQPINIATAAMRYASDQVRLLERDQAAGVEQTLRNFTKSLGRMQQGDIIGGLEQLGQDNAILHADGVRDGNAILAEYYCNTPEQRVLNDRIGALIVARTYREPAPFNDIDFWALMSPDFRDRNNIPDPTKALAQRNLAERTSEARLTCQRAFDEDGFCDCTVQKLGELGLDQTAFQSLSADFRSIVRLGREVDGVREAVRSCHG